MSDDELMEYDVIDGEEPSIMIGAAEEFDVESGMPVSRRGTASNSTTSTNTNPTVATSPSSVNGLTETWMQTIAEKNASNTFDKTAPHMIGIDEAGRGPVLGSMVYGVCWCPVNKLEELKAIKVADSKTLTFAQRSALFRTIESTPWLGYEVDVITADRLSREMLRRNRVNLNAISHDSAIMLIQKVIDFGVNVRQVFVDTVGDAGKYQEKLQSFFPGIDITVSKKADSLFPVVSAASIAAKVTRDLNLEVWQFEEARPQSNGVIISPSEYALQCSRRFGSGYPGDPLTKIWLQNHLDPIFGYPQLVRFSWGTTKKILKTEAVQVEWGDEPDDDEADDAGDEDAASGNQKLGKFFTAKEAETNKSSIATAGSVAFSSPQSELIQVNPNNKKFSLLHDSVTRKQHAIPQKDRVGWFQQHQMNLATTF